jgi:hypothetical protein
MAGVQLPINKRERFPTNIRARFTTSMLMISEKAKYIGPLR